jgi:hypothetical protein
MYYIDGPDGKPKRVKKFLGNTDQLTKAEARKMHVQTMEDVNHARGGAAVPVSRGKTFKHAVDLWRQAIAPNLSPATLRQRESYLRVHILPRF